MGPSGLTVLAFIVGGHRPLGTHREQRPVSSDPRWGARVTRRTGAAGLIAAMGGRSRTGRTAAGRDKSALIDSTVCACVERLGGVRSRFLRCG